MAAQPPSWKIQMAISPRRIIRFTPCLVLGWGFRGRRIEWRYFRFCQIQDGGSAAILEDSNGSALTSTGGLKKQCRIKVGAIDAAALGLVHTSDKVDCDFLSSVDWRQNRPCRRFCRRHGRFCRRCSRQNRPYVGVSLGSFVK